MASPQPTDSHTRISNELYTQILMRDFSKRQRAILDLIIRLSYGTGQKTALIPLTKDFEVCGVPANKVRKELDSLRQMSVIAWDTDKRVYWLNKDYDTWLVDKPTEDTERRFRELLKLNLKVTTHDQNGHAQNSHDDQNGQQNMTEKGRENGPKRSSVLPEIPSGAWADGVPITNDNYLYKKELVREDSPNGSWSINDYLIPLLQAGKDVFAPYGIAQALAYELADLLVRQQLSPELGREALMVSQKLYGNEGFSKTKLRRWLQSGVTDVEAAREFEERNFGNKDTNSHGGDVHGVNRTSLESDDELERIQDRWAANGKEMQVLRV